ncbi:EF-P beta-lysylation protein EpmB [Nitrincola alkalilacustris]|uniref:EF-P beta-lysylation protein EpmB n=1 Tax=Nitrincola alkalilacustris TaxID=1571224 RepID=UPI00124F473E|nr:EF-P beta-lysylation protein EpmB [Nitrincola alkalilacustris]
MSSPLYLPEPWQQTLREAVSDPAELIRLLELPETLLPDTWEASRAFSLKVPAPYLARIRKGDPDDPLLKQILPIGQEMVSQPGYMTDPLAEMSSNPEPGLVHKYRDRVLLILSGACAINCRYCFRRHFPYEENQIGTEQWQRLLDYIRRHPEVTEVILSGGDPLATPDRRIIQMLRDLEQIPQLKRLRIHSRMPVVIPQRITPELTQALATNRLRCVMVLHINHANEIDQSVAEAIKHLRDKGITVLNQAVLLRGINATISDQKSLSEALFECGVLPYYLFLLDPVEGSAHFDLPDQEAQHLIGELQTQLPGYLVPRLAREIPGRKAKTILAPIQVHVNE